MTHSLMVTYWTGGGAPAGSRTKTFSDEDPRTVLEMASDWFDRQAGALPEPEADDEPDDAPVLGL